MSSATGVLNLLNSIKMQLLRRLDILFKDGSSESKYYSQPPGKSVKHIHYMHSHPRKDEIKSYVISRL